MQRLSTDEATIGARQKDKARSNLAGLADAPHGRRAQAAQLLLGHGADHQGRPDRAWRHRVDADPLADLLLGQSAGEGDDGAFGGGIVEQAWRTHVGVLGGVVDDAVASTQMRQRVLGKMEDGVDVGVEGAEPLLSVSLPSENSPGKRKEHILGDFRNVVLHHLVGGIVDQDIETAELTDGLVDGGFAIARAPQVRGQQVHLTAILFHLSFGLLCILFLFGQVGNERVSTLHGEEDGHRPSNARVTAGDQGLLARQFASGLVDLIAAVLGGQVCLGRLGIHVGFESWMLLLLDWGLVVCIGRRASALGAMIAVGAIFPVILIRQPFPVPSFPSFPSFRSRRTFRKLRARRLLLAHRRHGHILHLFHVGSCLEQY